MTENEYVTLQERLDALEYETGSRMDMFDSAIRNVGGFDQPEEVTFTDKLKQAGNWISRNKEGLLVASVTVAVGVVAYALYKGQKQEAPSEVVGKIVPIREFLSTDYNHRWGLVMHKYDGDGNEVSLFDVADQLINGEFKQVDDNITIFDEEEDYNEKR